MPAETLQNPTRTASPIPSRGESQAAFAIRFHQAMAEAIPETDRRNAAMMSVWREHGGNAPFERITADRFPESQYRHVPDIPEFAEHTTRRVATDPHTGEKREEPVVYDRDALIAVMNRCNERILDTHDFSPITEGHTPDREAVDNGARMPDVLGYAGPYRLGMIGNVNPRWAIFADEWHQKEDVPKLNRMRRRSPEVWLEDRMEDRFFDPIAALGAETPRLDLGMARFCRTADGRLVEKYTAVAPAAGNVFVPGDGGDSRKRQPYQSEAGQMALSREDVNEIVSAMLETPQMQWVSQQMESQPAEGDGPGEDPGDGTSPLPPEAPAAPAPAPAPAPPAAPPQEEPEQMRRHYQCDDDDRDMMSRYMSGEVDEDEMQQYMSGKRSRYQADGSAEDGDSGDPPNDGDVADDGVAHYSRGGRGRLEREIRTLRQQNAKYQKQMDEVQREREEARRERIIHQYSREYAIDVEAELKRCAVAKMSRDAFEARMSSIAEFAEHIPMADVVPMMPTPDIPSARGKSGPTEAQATEARKYCMAQRSAGKHIEYEQALEHVMSGAG